VEIREEIITVVMRHQWALFQNLKRQKRGTRVIKAQRVAPVKKVM